MAEAVRRSAGLRAAARHLRGARQSRPLARRRRGARARWPRAGVRVLDNEAVQAGPLAIGGLDDDFTGHERSAATLAAMRAPARRAAAAQPQPRSVRRRCPPTSA